MTMAKAFTVILALSAELTASLHERQKGKKVVLVQPIHELLRTLRTAGPAVTGRIGISAPVGRLRRRPDIGA
jgi:hypothetical protein